MKKLLIIATVLLAGVSNAVEIDWSLNVPTKVTFDNTSVGKNGSAYVVFLGSDTLDSLTYADVIAKASVGTSPYPTSVGKINKKPVTVDSVSGLGNYALYMTYVADEKTYYNVSTSIYTLTAAGVEALFNEGTELPASSFAFTDSKPSATLASASASSGGWVAVPEPGTAAMALLGLGLLVRRRKAKKA